MMRGLAWTIALICGCSDEPRCDRDGCDDGELCVVAGSDVAGEDSTYACIPAPAACTAEVDCACVAEAASRGERPGNLDLAFCLGEGGCADSARGPVVSCPGG